MEHQNILSSLTFFVFRSKAVLFCIVFAFDLHTGVIRETLVHRCHVVLLCGENGAPCGQQLLAWRNPFKESLMRDHRRRTEGKRGVDGASRCWSVLQRLSPPGHRDTPGSSWLSPPRSAPATSWSRQKKGRLLHTAPQLPLELPAQQTHT